MTDDVWWNDILRHIGLEIEEFSSSSRAKQKNESIGELHGVSSWQKYTIDESEL